MKNTTIYVCEECGEESQKWQGKCDSCNAWNTLKELHIESALSSQSRDKSNYQNPQKISQIKSDKEFKISTKLSEVDLVFGGGIVNGEIALIAGNPGIGKSTLVLQLSNKIDGCLYISAEESLNQIKSRWERLGLINNNTSFLSTADINEAIEGIIKTKPKLVIIDSIQAISDSTNVSSAGNPVQVKLCSLKLQNLAKKSNTPIIITSHVTKSGIVAGPKTLEHLVDGVFYIEGEKESQVRILRSVKNRYGPIDEIGIFKMTNKGMEEVNNLENLFMDKEILDEPGVAVSSIVEGNRPIIVEIQVLAVKSCFGFPKRVSSGIDINKINLLSAVLEGTSNHKLSKYDLFFNLVGGIKTKDDSINLALVIAMVSAIWKKAIPKNIIAIGEVGLTGEIRQPKMIEKQIRQAQKLGFKTIIAPFGNCGKNVIMVRNIKEAIVKVFGKKS